MGGTVQTRVLRSKLLVLLPPLAFTLLLAACGGDSSGSAAVAAGTGADARSGKGIGFHCLRWHRHCLPTTTPTNTPPTISGTLATSIPMR
jgi:hypothetical protein